VPPPAPAPSPDLARHLRAAVGARLAARFQRDRQVARAYMRFRSDWIRSCNTRRQALQGDALDAARDVDRFLFMTTRGADVESIARTGSGRVTSKASPPAAQAALPSSLSEVDIMLNEIEATGGTAGGQERWGRNLAVIPDQNTSYVASAGVGSALLMDPLEDHYAVRARNPWSRAERHLFLEKWLAHGKNFRRMAQFFDHKTVYDIQRFYFQHKNRLRLKQLTKEFSVKRRNQLATKKQVLWELSRDPCDVDFFST